VKGGIKKGQEKKILYGEGGSLFSSVLPLTEQEKTSSPLRSGREDAPILLEESKRR